jgi:CheY-like chemotaxis protein
MVAEKLDANVQRACDGVEAIQYLAGENKFANRDAFPLPELVVLDLKMPRKSGFEVLGWVRNHPDFGKLPVIVFSSSEEPADVKKAYSLGANAYLVKPSSYLAYSEVIRTLRGFLLHGVEQQMGKNPIKTYHKPLSSG